ncbi:MAG: hypothetical protein VB051_00655 [Candidatus Pelethousia sp.]|nr:hypothetical protein [Candidatus Pelethousia sp.]
MKKQVLFSLILAAVLLLVPVGVLAADATPTGSGNALSSNGAEAFTITTKDKLDSTAMRASLAGFTEGDASAGATVACWKDADGSLKFVYLSNATELTLNAGKTANLSGNVSIGSLTIGAGAGLIVPAGTDTAKNSLTAETTVIVSDGGTLTNSGTVTAKSGISTTGSKSTISNGSGSELITPTVEVGAGGRLTNEGSIAGSLINQGNADLDGGTVSGHIENSGDVVGTKPLTIGKDQKLTITGTGYVSPSIVNDGGAVTLKDEALVRGTVSNTGAGTLNVEGGEVSGKVTNNSGATVNVSGGTLNNVTNSGALTVSAGQIDGNISNETGGALTLSGAGAINKPLNNAGGFTMTGGTLAGSLDNGGTAAISGGTVNANISNESNMSLSGVTVNGDMANAGALTLGDGVTLAGDVVENGEDGTITGSSLSIGSGTDMFNEGIVSAKAVTVNGTLENKKGGTIAQDSTLTNNGKLTNAGIIASSSLSNTGTLTNQSKGEISSAAVSNSGTLTNAKDGRIANKDATVTNTGTLTNSGTITAKVTNEKSGTLTNKSVITGAVTNNGGTVTNAESGSMSGSITNGEGGTISNGGSISGDVDNKGTIKNTTDTASVSGKVTGKEIESTDAAKPITATNSEKTVTLSDMPAGSVLTTAKLAESSDGYKSLKSTAKDAKVICAYDITCNKTFTGTKTLTFLLGKDYAGKTITALHYINGIVDTYKGKADSSGNFSMPITSLSPFMLVEGAVSGSGSGGSGSKPVKTGDAADSLPGLSLILLAAGVYIWRKRTA